MRYTGRRKGTGREKGRGEQKQEGEKRMEERERDRRHGERWAEKQKFIFIANSTYEYASVTHLPALLTSKGYFL